MPDFTDDVFLGRLSRRRFIDRLAAAGVGASILQGVFPDELAAARGVEPEAPGFQSEPKYSPANIGGGGRIERNFYREWLETSGVPRVDVYNIRDARSQELHPWPEIGGRGLYLNFTGNVHMDSVIYEIPEGKALEPRRNCYEQLLYVLGGRGHTVVGEGSRRLEVSWGEGAQFTIPLNVPHRHVNEDAAKPARLIAVTSFPFMIQCFGSLGMIENLKHDFADRYDGSPDYFEKSEKIHKRWWRLNKVDDLRTTQTVAWEERGEGNASAFWAMGGNTILEPHISEFPVETYKLGHRHPYEAVILTLNGKGFSLAAKDGLSERNDPLQIDWQAGSIISPPYYWYHQHFNTGRSMARYWAITEGDFPKRLGIPLQVEQIEPADEDPSVRERFERELGKERTGDALPNPGLHHHGPHGHAHPSAHGHVHRHGPAHGHSG